MMIRRLIAATVFGLTASTAHAEVQSVDAGGFTIVHSAASKLSPDDAYRAFLNVGGWWSSAHTYSGDARNLTLQPRPGGCWCEVLPSGGFVRHMTLEAAIPGKSVRLTGALGPLANLGAQGVLSASFAPAQNGGSAMTVTYVVNGRNPDGWDALSRGVDAVLAEQVVRLAARTTP